MAQSWMKTKSTAQIVAFDLPDLPLLGQAEGAVLDGGIRLHLRDRSPPGSGSNCAFELPQLLIETLADSAIDDVGIVIEVGGGHRGERLSGTGTGNGCQRQRAQHHARHGEAAKPG